VRSWACRSRRGNRRPLRIARGAVRGRFVEGLWRSAGAAAVRVARSRGRSPEGAAIRRRAGGDGITKINYEGTLEGALTPLDPHRRETQSPTAGISARTGKKALEAARSSSTGSAISTEAARHAGSSASFTHCDRQRVRKARRLCARPAEGPLG